MLPVWLTDSLTTDLDRALHYTQLWGLEGVELRTVGKAGDRVPHVNERKLISRLLDTEMTLSAIQPGLFEGPATDLVARLNEIAALQESLAFCGRTRCPLVVSGGFTTGGEADLARAVDLLKRAGDRVGPGGGTLVVQHERGALCETASQLADVLHSVSHPHVRAAWNPAEALQAGESPEVGLEALAPYIALVRVRDGHMRDGAWEEAVPGQGSIPWVPLLKALSLHGFKGPLSLDARIEPKPRTMLHAATFLVDTVSKLHR